MSGIANAKSAAGLSRCARLRRLLIALVVAVGVGLGACLGVSANPAAAYAGEPLSVYVGYAGGPYFLKHAYSVEELESLAVGPYLYSAIDNKPALVKYAAWGVPLETLFATAVDDQTGYAVNTTDLWRLAFDTEDDYKPDNGVYGNEAWYWNYYSFYTSGRLLDTSKVPRYYYSAMGENFNYSSTTIIAGREDAIVASGTTVPSMIALKYSTSRITSLDQWRSFDALGVDDLDRSSNRLAYGQTGITDRDVENELHSINGVYAIYSGKPTITLDQETIKGNIGETVRVHASITAADPLIAQEGLKEISWTTSNDKVATVTPNGDGSADVLFRGKGDVTITASFGNSPSDEFVSSATALGSGPGGSGWREEGEGEGKEYGQGDGEKGPGTNHGAGEGEQGPGESEGDGAQDGAASEDGDSEEGEESASAPENETDAAPSDGATSTDTDPSGRFTSVPDEAVAVTMAVQSPSATAASGEDAASAAAGEEAAELEEVVPEQQMYRIRQDQVPLSEMAEQLPEAATVGFPLPLAIGLVVSVLLGALLELVYYGRSVDWKAGFSVAELMGTRKHQGVLAES